MVGSVHRLVWLAMVWWVLPMVALGRTHIVIPCYNEEARLPRQQFLDFTGDEAHTDLHFTFVNDGSSDDTIGVIRELANMRPGKISFVDIKANGGKAEAVRKGMMHVLKEAQLGHGDSVGFWDADLATPLETISNFVRVMENMPEIEMVFGARVALLGRDIRRKADRHYLGRIFATLASIVLDLPIYDTQCGAKLFRATKDLSAALSEPFSSSWIFDIELIARFIKQKEKGGGAACQDVIYEYPLETWHDVAGSKLGFLEKVKALYGLASIWTTYFSSFGTGWPPASRVGGHQPEL
uniref:Glycosyltransferase 2-like domain-containing protein n=1 Tax=Hemiselmis andersenii TaxID=464988 RepID=A0A6U4T7A5_HEMAN